MENKSEQGFSILEILISISINALLLAGGIILIYNGIQSYIYAIGDLELIEEVRYTAQRIHDHIRFSYGNEVGENTIKLYVKDISTNNFSEVDYTTSKGIIYCNNQPITGNTILGNIEMRRLAFTDNHDGTIHMVIEGVNLINGHSFSVENNVLCYAEFIEKSASPMGK